MDKFNEWCINQQNEPLPTPPEQSPNDPEPLPSFEELMTSDINPNLSFEIPPELPPSSNINSPLEFSLRSPEINPTQKIPILDTTINKYH